MYDDGIYVLYSTLISPKINYFHNETDIMSEQIYDQYSELKSKKTNHQISDPYINKLNDVVNFFDRSKYFFRTYGMKNGIYVHFNLDNSYHIKLFNINEKSNEPFDELKKYNTLLHGQVGEHLHNYVKQYNTNCEKEEHLYKFNMKLLKILMDHIELNGNMYITFRVICKSYQIEYLILLSYLFKKVTIMKGIGVLCEEFLGEKLISKSEIVKLSQKKFTIESDQNKLIIEYLKKTYEYFINLYNYYLTNNRNQILKHYLMPNYYNIIVYNVEMSDKIKHNIQDLFDYVISLIDDISNISHFMNNLSGNFLVKKINYYRCKYCLEFGCEYGITTLFMLSQPNTTVISIDANQKLIWNNYGKNLIKRLNLSDRHKLIEDEPIIVLPKLINKHNFDLIYINGIDRFDLLIIYFYYSLNLLDPNGIIIIPNIYKKSINKFINYIDSNYKFCRRIVSPNSIACYKKITNDLTYETFINF